MFSVRRFACHRLYVSADGCYSKYVVELKEDESVNRYFPLKEEISATQWIGGVIVLSPFGELEIRSGESFHCFLQRVTVEVGEPSFLYAWYIADFDFAKKEFTSASKLIRL